MTITPDRLTWQQYRDQLWRSLLKSEGDIRRVYSDGKGIPTVGVGLALVVRRGGSWQVPPDIEIRRFLGDRVTTADRTLLQRQARLLNNRLTTTDLRYYRTTMISFRGRQRSLWDAAGLAALGRPSQPGQPARPVRLTLAQIQRLGRIAIPDVGGQSRHIGGGHNRFSFTLRDGDPRRIFNTIIPRFERGVRNLILARQPRLRGVSAAAARGLANGLHTAPNASANVAGHGSREMIALVSVHFNGVVPRRTVDAALRGDRAEAYFEIVYDTNPRRSIGVADRRNHEGEFMLPRSWTDAHFNQFVAMKRRRARQIRAYENHPNLTMLMRQGVSRPGSLRRLRGGRIVPGRPPRLSKFFPGQSRDIDAILFSANNPNNTLRRLIEVGGLDGRLDGGPPVRRAALPRAKAGRSLMAALSGGKNSDTGKPATEAERRAFQAFLAKGTVGRLLRAGVMSNLNNVKRMAESDGNRRAAANLQNGLNELARRDRAGTLPAGPLALVAGASGETDTDMQDQDPTVPLRPIGPIRPVKVDGAIGPKTLLSLTTAAAKAGPAAVDQATGLARFRDFARRAKVSGSPTGLGEAARTSFGSLFGREKSEGAALQGTINEIDRFTGGSGSVLAEDGVVGPRTEAAFRDTMSFADEKDFADEFAFDHGFQ